jgi:hypothetical protein
MIPYSTEEYSPKWKHIVSVHATREFDSKEMDESDLDSQNDFEPRISNLMPTSMVDDVEKLGLNWWSMTSIKRVQRTQLSNSPFLKIYSSRKKPSTHHRLIYHNFEVARRTF